MTAASKGIRVRPGSNGWFRASARAATVLGFLVAAFANQGSGAVYDNRMGLPEDMDTADPTAIGGGSIVIHK
jgi:hypothetical protein